MKKLYIIILLFSAKISEAQFSRTWLNQCYGRFAVSYSKGSNKSLYLFDPLMHEEFNTSSYATPSLGESILYNGGLGIMFTKNIGFETNFSYLDGFNTSLYDFKTSNYRVSATTKNHQLLWLPTTVFRLDIKKFHPYIKVGLMIPLMNSSRLEYKMQDEKNNSKTYDYKLTNQLNVGINGCVGVSYSVSPKIEIFFEAEEDNIRSFHVSADLQSTTSTGNFSGQAEPLSHYTFVPSVDINNFTNKSSNFLNFPISFNREAYNLGVKINFK